MDLIAGRDSALRNIDPKSRRYEIRGLGEHAAAKPILLLTNAYTQLDLAELLFCEAATQHQASRSNRATSETATRLLLGSGLTLTPYLGGDSC